MVLTFVVFILSLKFDGICTCLVHFLSNSAAICSVISIMAVWSLKKQAMGYDWGFCVVVANLSVSWSSTLVFCS